MTETENTPAGPEGSGCSESPCSVLQARTPAEAVNLLERVQMEYMRLDDELRKGKGDWSKSMRSNLKVRYIQDDTWASWIYAHTMLESMLRTFDPDFLSQNSHESTISY